MYEPRKLCRALGNPTSADRKFHPVYVASGTMMRGTRMPEVSLPPGSTCGTSERYVPRTRGGSGVMPLDHSAPRSTLYGSYRFREPIFFPGKISGPSSGLASMGG